ncbi:hypothetical protein SASPL_120887 [Salvia splendens]|uniref:Agenet domain-containing protein n=1 Tax=Salvia splendens TaxID=180675 RepID=A0A8X8XVF5_SALSN|nr:uncharacterized protein LOC121742023 [Salvia splendens]KAG6418683.1 hypothetical protein SASPL_120887 [Salvia splendens]
MMENKVNLPFKVGQLAEVRSFEEGFRGAWFRCKIQKICKKKGILGHALEYIDFSEEKVDWTKLYQVPSYYSRIRKGYCGELMVRPPYPPLYNEKEMPHVAEISEVTVIAGDSWRVGNFVDWWSSDCYWSGHITQLLGDDKAQIELTPPPYGEGSSYEVLFKDLRPSLDWSPELGWTLPTQEGDICCRVVKPVNQVIDEGIRVEDLHNTGQETEASRRSASSLFSSPTSSNSAVSDIAKGRTTTEKRTCLPGKTISKKQMQKTESARQGGGDSRTRKTGQLVADSGQKRTCLPEKIICKNQKNKKESPREGAGDCSTSKTGQVLADSAQKRAELALEGQNLDYCQGMSGRHVLHSKCSDHVGVEAAILDLEEYLNKIKWLRKLMQYGTSSAGAQMHHWEFVEQVNAIEIQK